MKRIILLIICIFITGFAFAQIPGGGPGMPSITGKISGIIIDSISKKPVDYATIALSRSGTAKSTNGSLTDEKGFFKIDNIGPGSYRITIAFLGYQTKILDPIKTSPGKPDLNLGRIILSPNLKMLGEVVVTGQAAIIENKIDKIVYNAERDVTISGGNATDVLQKVPLLAVDIDGNVSLRGSQNVKVLINGKPSGSMANNMADALKMIPADQIKSVEVITSPSAKYDAEGTSGIINIITKKKNVQGVSGSISGGFGTRQNGGNANLNVKKGRLGITGNIGGRGSWPQTALVSFNQVDQQNHPVFNQSSSSETSRLGFRGSVGADYDINGYNTITSTLNFNRFGNTFAGDVFSTRYINNVSTLITSNTDRDLVNPGFDWSTDYTKKFKKQGEEISFAGQLSKNKSLQDYTTFYSKGANPDEIGNNDANNQEITLQVDYVYPFKKLTWEVGAKTIMRDITSETLVDTLAGNSFVKNNNRSNIFDYNQDVASAYSTFGFTLGKKYGIKLGGRMEYTKISGNSSSTSILPFDNNYFNFVPSATISRTFKKSQTVKISYNKRISRPSLFYLNPFRNASDPINQSEGNPGLSPEISSNIELGYSTFIKTTVINASLFYRHTNDVIESFVGEGRDLTTDSVINLQTFKNIGSNNSMGMSLFGSVTPIQKLTLRGNLNLSTYDINLISGNYSNAGDKTYFLYNAFLSASKIFKGGFTAETFVNLNSPRRTAQGKSASFNLWNIGVKKEILKKKGTIGLNIIDPLNARKNFKSELSSPLFNQTSNFSLPFRSVGVNLSWQFGKMNFNQQPRKKRGVNNDDLKQGEQGNGNQ